MALSNDWEMASGHTLAELDKTTPLLSETSPGKFEKNLPNSLLHYQQQLPSPPSMSLVPMNENITLRSSTLPSTFTTHPDVSKTPKVSPTSRIDQISSAEVSFAMQTSSDLSISCGAMTDRAVAACTPRSAPTTTLAQDPPTAVRMVQSAVSLGSSSMTHLPEEVSRKSVSLNEPHASSKHVSLMLEHSDDSGCSNPPCLTTISMMDSSLRVATLSEEPSSSSMDLGSTSRPVSSQQLHTSSPVQTQDGETNENAEKVLNQNCSDANGDDDEWEILNETLVYADCVGAVESDLMEPGKSVLLVDFDSDNPLIQIGPAIFQGVYEDCLGTNLIFEKHQKNPGTLETGNSSTQSSLSAGSRPTIDVFSSRSKISTRAHYTYVGKTTKNLNLNRVFLKPKQ